LYLKYKDPACCVCGRDAYVTPNASESTIRGKLIGMVYIELSWSFSRLQYNEQIPIVQNVPYHIRTLNKMDAKCKLLLCWAHPESYQTMNAFLVLYFIHKIVL